MYTVQKIHSTKPWLCRTFLRFTSYTVASYTVLCITVKVNGLQSWICRTLGFNIDKHSTKLGLYTVAFYNVQKTSTLYEFKLHNVDVVGRYYCKYFLFFSLKMCFFFFSSSSHFARQIWRRRHETLSTPQDCERASTKFRRKNFRRKNFCRNDFVEKTFVEKT